MKLWSFQPNAVIEKLLAGEEHICEPALSWYYNDEDMGFKNAYDWLCVEMAKSIPKPAAVKLPIWAWATHHGGQAKPDRRTLLFNRYPKDESILELEVPDDEVLLSDWDDWHSILNNWEIRTPKEWEEDEDREYTEAEKLATWPRVFDVGTKDYVQACFWKLKPAYVVKAHRVRKKAS